jgi:N-methylhydantoinase A/oxoprolinase/acetone carboxylase beta subunit
MIIGLDVGGTHTDVVLLDNAGLLREVKVTTDASDLFRSVLKGLDAVTEGVDTAAIRRIVLSTTLTTNAIIQGTIPAVGMIVSAGPGIDPEHFRTNPHYVCVKGCIDHRGREIEPVRPEEIQAAAARFRDTGIRQVGVVGKFSVRNPAHEIRIRELLGDSFDTVFLGHRVSGNLNFSRRIATTYLNAAVYPIHKSFFDAVLNSLSAKGMHLPLRLLKADGGNMRLESSVEYPAQTIFSGPAASVMGAVAMATGDEDAIVMDIGGTTTDLAVLIGRAPVLDPHGITIGPYRTLIRSLETLSIGMGGDSAVRLRNGRLTVGPDREGPAMLFGGSVPTPTDALAIVGDIVHADCGRACAGLKLLAASMGIPIEALADRVVETACRAMLEAAERLTAHINGKPVYTLHEFKEGYQVRPRSILVLGGPAPYFARHLQRLTSMQVRVVPRWQVANAIGAALARTTCEVGLFADTEQRVASAPVEKFLQTITDGYSLEAATTQALDLLRVKALERGANPVYLEMEVVESQQFNMVRGFTTSGKNIRIRVQVKPGLIHGYDNLLKSLAASGGAERIGAEA